MVSWDDNASRPDASLALIVRIEGYGEWLDDVELAAADDDARVRFCIALPSYAASMPGSGGW